MEKSLYGFEAIISQASEVNPGDSEPSITHLKDGKLLLAYTYFYSGEASNESPSRISGKLSETKGESWGKRFPLQELESGINIISPSLLVLSSGELLLFYTHKQYTRVSHIFCKTSLDEGKTWRAPVEITKENRLFNMLNDSVIQLSNRRILVPVCQRDPRAENYVSHCYYSDDKGRTWRKGRGEIKLTRKGATDPSVVELKNGRILMTVRNQFGKIYQAYSLDKGLTWINLDSIEYQTSDSPVKITRIPSTMDLLMIWNNGTTRNPLNIAVSEDEGETWDNIKVLENSTGYESSHPAITFIGEEALIAYNFYDVKKRWVSIKLKKIKIDSFYNYS